MWGGGGGGSRSLNPPLDCRNMAYRPTLLYLCPLPFPVFQYYKTFHYLLKTVDFIFIKEFRPQPLTIDTHFVG